MTYGTLKECKIHKHYGLKLDTTSLVCLYIQESRHSFFVSSKTFNSKTFGASISMFEHSLVFYPKKYNVE